MGLSPGTFFWIKIVRDENGNQCKKQSTYLLVGQFVRETVFKKEATDWNDSHRETLLGPFFLAKTLDWQSR